MIQVDIAVSVLLRIIHECARTYIGTVRATTCTRGTVAAPLPLEAVAFTTEGRKHYLYLSQSTPYSQASRRA